MPGFSEVLLILAAPFVGSFLGILIVRLPEGRPILFGRSQCDCGKLSLSAADLVPIASWVANWGRCRICSQRLAAFYPAIELAALAAAVWSLAVVGPEAAWVGTVFGWALLTLGWIDQRFLILPDILTLPLMLAGIAVTAIMSSGGLLDHLVGAAAGYLTLTLIAWLYRQWRGRDGLGQGDAKLFSALGAWVSWQGLPTVMLYATAVGIIVVSALSIRGASISPDRKLPFGTFLCVGGWLVWLYGPLLLN